MQSKPLFAALAAVAFAFPIAATAGTDKPAGAKSASAQIAPANDGGAEAMFTSMDKNKDGFIGKDEAANTPHAADFASLDKNADDKLSREEHANAKEHVAGRAKAGSIGSTAGAASTTGDKKTY